MISWHLHIKYIGVGGGLYKLVWVEREAWDEKGVPRCLTNTYSLLRLKRNQRETNFYINVHSKYLTIITKRLLFVLKVEATGARRDGKVFSV